MLFLSMQESSNKVKCPLPGCKMAAHTLCLAQQFLAVEGAKELIPVEGSCPGCKQAILWGDIIRYKMGCYQNLQVSQVHPSSESPGLGTVPERILKLRSSLLSLICIRKVKMILTF